VASESHASPRFFALRHAFGSPYDTSFEREGDVMGEPPRCPHCGDIVGLLTWLPPYTGKLNLHGQDFGDFVKGPGNGLLLSERLVDAFRKEGLTGLSGFHPVEMLRVRRQRRGPKPPVVPRYFYVSPAYGRAVIDAAHSRIRRSEPISCTYCRATGVDAIHGFSLEPGSWQGEDVFRPRGLHGEIVVSERFAQFVTQHGFTNMLLTPTEELVWDPLALGPPPSTPLGQA